MFENDLSNFVDSTPEDERYNSLEKSHLLAKQARKEIMNSGKTFVICPYCHRQPTIKTSEGGFRTTTSCECGYIYDCDIY